MGPRLELESAEAMPKNVEKLTLFIYFPSYPNFSNSGMFSVPAKFPRALISEFHPLMAYFYKTLKPFKLSVESWAVR